LNPAPCNVLMIYPRFSADSFWNYSVTAELLGARYPTIPLGLITLAAMQRSSARPLMLAARADITRMPSWTTIAAENTRLCAQSVSAATCH